jgi:ribokinase
VSDPGDRATHGRVIVVGSVNIDLVVTADRLPGPGETVTGGRFARHHGGKGGNQAVAAARLGAHTAFVGAIGDDALGAEARTALEVEGIDLRGLATLQGEATGVALIVVDANGENSIAVAGGANAALTEAHVRDAFRILAPAVGDVVLVGHEIPTAATAEALRLGSVAGATTILNPAPASGLGWEVLHLADILTPNRGELAVLAADDGPPEPVARETMMQNGVSAMLVSLGGDGGLFVDGDRSIELPALPVMVVDSVGAGDTLNGALAAGIAAGRSWDEAARRAIDAASLAVTRAGARAGMPTSAELQAAGG